MILAELSGKSRTTESWKITIQWRRKQIERGGVGRLVKNLDKQKNK